MSAAVTFLAATLLHFSPTAWIKSWLLYLGIQTHVRGTIDPELKPLHNVCEYLNALHVYADEARRGETRAVEAFHFCSHVRKDLRQCLIYDSNSPTARLIGVEYMIPRSKYLTLPQSEQKLWHSHEYEVLSGMLILPRPSSTQKSPEAWEKLETEAMTEVLGLYGKTFHFWDIDDVEQQQEYDIPMGMPKLMGSLTETEQLNVDEALRDRNSRFNVDHREKKKVRLGREINELSEGEHLNADSWWREAARDKNGLYGNGESEKYVIGSGQNR